VTSDLYWIPGPWRGRLAIATRPRGGDWLEGEVSAWKDAGVNTVVSLIEPDEGAELGLADEPGVVCGTGLEFRSFPIPDRGVPGSRVEFSEFLTELTSELTNGKNVAVHCRQGVGRSGMLAAAVLIAGGASAHESADIVGRARGVSVPETPDQLRWLEQLASAHPVAAR
jgi:hypothetical protein